ncbi:MAG: class I mannose-6-phosphate isomerase [Bacteroidetes bacterium]|nr:class I mannose-6-phosphate isomerase [Bacteroidota bacterium]
MKSNYDKKPFIQASGGDCWTGWEAITRIIGEQGGRVVVLETYPGVNDDEVVPQLKGFLPGRFFFTKDAFLPEQQISELVYPDVTDDDIFGYITRLSMVDFFDPVRLGKMREAIGSEAGPVYIYGPGATLVAERWDLLVYFDMPRWEGQLRFRRNEVANLGLTDKTAKASLQYKQAFFVDWRVADKHKKPLLSRWDFVVDTTVAGHPKIVAGTALNEAYGLIVRRPFRLVPFFDPGPWGGQWMKEVCDLDRSQSNYAWCFDCVPEENSLLIRFGDILFETPAINLVFAQSRALLGDAVQARFGDEFPIRFDFLDTMGGGNLSLQVHPTTEYIREHFGMDYTQDESYYILDAEDDAVVYLGLNDGVVPGEMVSALSAAQEGGKGGDGVGGPGERGDGQGDRAGGLGFDAEKFVGKWPIKKHDHVLIPAGTVHCSGRNSMVLEISATPYIFTFKLWDWGRMGLDGKPRPINIGHGQRVIDWSLGPERTKKELINVVSAVDEGPGWREERTGLHEREFIETRRHWFTGKVMHHTGGSVNVLNLVEGREAVVESPSGAFEPFIVHYAETFVVPEAVGEYTIRPVEEGARCATMKAFVRKNP